MVGWLVDALLLLVLVTAGGVDKERRQFPTPASDAALTHQQETGRQVDRDQRLAEGHA